MVFLEVRVAVLGTDRVGRGAKPKSSASFKDDGSNYLSAQDCWLFIAPGTFIVALQEQCSFAAAADGGRATENREERLKVVMIRKLKSGQYRLYSRKKDAKTGRRKNLGTFSSRDAAEQHEREVQYFKRH
jgi:hypothetical protein